MIVAARLASRELRSGVRGFRIFLVCLALGVGAIAAVQSISAALVAGLARDGRQILGGDLALQRHHEASEAERAYISGFAAAESYFVEMRTMARAAASGEATLVELKAVDDAYPLYGEVVLEDGAPFRGTLAARDGVFGALVEPAVLLRLGGGVGGRLSIGEQAYEIRGVISREPDRLGIEGTFGFGPRVMVARNSLEASRLTGALSHVHHHHRLRLRPNADVGAIGDGLLERFPRSGWRVRDFRDPSERVKRTIERLGSFLTLVGLATLLVGGVGAGNAIKGYLDGKVRTIATLKCLGASSAMVFGTYLLQVMVLAAAGIAIGLAIGAVAAPLTAGLIGPAGDVPIVGGLYPGALALAAAFGLLSTLAFSLPPLAAVRDVPPAALFRGAVAPRRRRWSAPFVVLSLGCAGALAGLTIATAANTRFAVWFVLGTIAAVAIYRTAAELVMAAARRLRRARHPSLRVAIGNLCRPEAATTSVMLSLGLGLTVLATVVQIEGNFTLQVERSLPERAPALFFVDIQSDQIDRFGALAGSIAGAGELTTVPYLRGRIVAVKGTPAEDALRDERFRWLIDGDRGLTYAERPPPKARIVEGEWWGADYAGPPLLSVHRDVASAFALEMGDSMTVSVLGREITATVTNVRELPWSSLSVNFALVFSPQPLRGAPHAYLATLEANSAGEAAVYRRVSEVFPNITIVRVTEALAIVSEMLERIAGVVRWIAAITLLAGTLVLAGAVAAGHHRRVYECVVLKVLGATRRQAVLAYALEYGLLGVLTALIAAALGTVAAWAVLTQVMQLEWVFLPGPSVASIALCAAVTLGAGFAGAWRALGVPAAPLLRNA